MEKFLNMLKNFKVLSMVAILLFVSSCAIYCCATKDNGKSSVGGFLPRESFVKMEKRIHIRTCPKNVEKLTQCTDRKIGSSGSGFIFKNDGEGAYVITAGHICDDSELKAFLRTMPAAELASKLFHVINIDNERYKFMVLAYDMDIDVCVGYVYSLAKPAITVSKVAPRPGDVVYNLAAPIGIFDEQSVPILDGYYVGKSGNMAQYSVPAAGGSSGSPLFNSNGELIGLIHSVYVRFPFITLSPTYKQLINFMYTHSDKESHMAERLLYKYLNF
tara:strand:- start:5267 stop:6088 length:822 start_codon:yes stop_codon:yes gene_type:complete